MKKRIAIIGAGSAALALAGFLDPEKFEVKIYEKNKTAGRKFLVAGKGGFNLTHSEEMTTFVKKYTPASFLVKSLLSFSNEDLREWMENIGIPTVVGSSKRVYPIMGIKPIEVLKKIMNALEKRGVRMQYQYEWLGWNDENALEFMNHKTEEKEIISPDITVFAMGGASWKVTGSDGSWRKLFSDKGILTREFRAVNCAYKVDWPAAFIKQYAGQPLKNLEVICLDKKQKGEAVVTNFGLEGNAIYGLSTEIEKQFVDHGAAMIHLDFKPMFSVLQIQQKLEQSKGLKRTELLRKALKLSKVQLALLKIILSKKDFTGDLKTLSKLIKHIPVALQFSAPLNEAISTIGGIELEELTEDFELKKIPNTYCIGEMLDWNAPTGGYLLQACFSMGVALARGLNS